MWALFGGRSEAEDGGEPAVTWRREIREELGIALEPSQVMFLRHYAFGRHGHRHTFCAEWPALSEDFVLGEGQGYAWYPLAEVGALPNVIDRHRNDLLLFQVRAAAAQRPSSRMRLTDVQVVPVAPEEKAALDRLLQLYQYDFAEIEGRDVDATGVYRRVDGESIWRDPNWRLFFVRVGGALAGFAFVATHESVIEPGATTFQIDEFFVMRKYRRAGVGEHVARALFDRFPGRWEVAQLPDNAQATAFWHAAIGRYTAGHFQEVWVDSPRWGGPVQTFVSAAD
jgi:predicted acetyltransferase